MRIPLMFLNSLGSNKAKRVGILECAHTGWLRAAGLPLLPVGWRRLPEWPPRDTGEIYLQHSREECLCRCVNGKWGLIISPRAGFLLLCMGKLSLEFVWVDNHLLL